MKKLSLLAALVIMLVSAVQCTEDEAVEASMNQTEFHQIESGEEGADGPDNDKDEHKN